MSIGIGCGDSYLLRNIKKQIRQNNMQNAIDKIIGLYKMPTVPYPANDKLIAKYPRIIADFSKNSDFLIKLMRYINLFLGFFVSINYNNINKSSHTHKKTAKNNNTKRNIPIRHNLKLNLQYQNHSFAFCQVVCL